jgi:hypothetical protein
MIKFTAQAVPTPAAYLHTMWDLAIGGFPNHPMYQFKGITDPDATVDNGSTLGFCTSPFQAISTLYESCPEPIFDSHFRASGITTSIRVGHVLIICSVSCS